MAFLKDGHWFFDCLITLQLIGFFSFTFRGADYRGVLSD
jgi:hypothetical protein